MRKSRKDIVFTAEGRLNTKHKRIQRFSGPGQLKELPDSYTSNSTKEELCLEYVNSFLDQFTSLYPKRQTPFMIAENECGVPKFICNTLRPTQLPFSELYDLYECASFLSGYIHYEPLDPPTAPPNILTSPTTTLQDYTGDCFDIAILLCSFLLGAGYDAYVVHGYAPRTITLRDQSHTAVPIVIGTNKETTSSLKKDSRSDDLDEDEENPYKPPDNSVKKSSYVAMEAERRRLEGLDTFVLWQPSTLVDGMNSLTLNDPVSNRVHAWVLVKAGYREMKESLFVEPTTGRTYQLSSNPYLGVESVFNYKNYWINMSPMAKVTEIDFDFENTSIWEYLFIPSKSGAGDSNKSYGSGEGTTEDMMAEGEDMMGAAAENSQAVANQANQVPFDPPPSWVAPLTFERKEFLVRYPPLGRRTVQYLRSKADFFARNTQSQGMVMRVTIYYDDEKCIVQEIHEWFENRTDKIYKRVRYFLGEKKFIEYFHPGSRGEVKMWVEYPGKQRDVDFYINGRLDRMFRREEIIGKKVTEYFEGRSDKLKFRAVMLTQNRSDVGSRQYVLPPLCVVRAREESLGQRSLNPASELYVTKMITVFDKDPTVPAGSDVAKRTYQVREGKLTARYHFVPGKITCTIKVWRHTKSSNNTLDSDEGAEVDDLEALQEALALERETYTQIKLSFNQMLTVLKFRSEMEDGVDVQPTIFESAVERTETAEVAAAKAKAEAVEGKNNRSSDYLTPFLRHLKDPSKITREEAMDIRQTCLDSLKARLVERSSIIQNRLNEENAKLARKQEQFQRSQRDGDISTEEYEKYCTDAMFRIHILEQRLVAHEEAALKKFADLDTKLASEPRLKVLRGNA